MSEHEWEESEVKTWSLELKICWFIHPWNRGFAPKNFDEWVDIFYILFITEMDNYNLENSFITKERLNKELRDRAKMEYDKIYNFITKYILDDFKEAGSNLIHAIMVDFSHNDGDMSVKPEEATTDAMNKMRKLISNN